MLCHAINSLLVAITVTIYKDGLAHHMKLASAVGFSNSVLTTNRKAYLAYCTGVRSLHALGSQQAI